MIVLDASAAVDLLLWQAEAEGIAEVVASSDVHTADLAFVEVMSALRRWELNGELAPARAGEAVQDLFDLQLEIHPVDVLARHTWSLRASVTTSDAIYVLLAQTLQAPLLTTDRRLARVAPQWCDVVELLPREAHTGSAPG